MDVETREVTSKALWEQEVRTCVLLDQSFDYLGALPGLLGTCGHLGIELNISWKDLEGTCLGEYLPTYGRSVALTTLTHLIYWSI